MCAGGCRPARLPTLARKQLELLRIAAPRLKPGCVMVYSTCSLEAEEKMKESWKLFEKGEQLFLRNATHPHAP